jgi:hypothetical protein
LNTWTSTVLDEDDDGASYTNTGGGESGGHVEHTSSYVCPDVINDMVAAQVSSDA